LEYVFSLNYIEKLPNICAILYRQIKLDDFGNKQIEGREYNEAERANRFLDLAIPEVFGVLQNYLSFKKKFMETFEELFLEPDFEPIEAEEKTKDDITKEKLLVKWSWERTIYMLANEDVLKFNEVVKLPLVFVFNMLSMKKDLKI
jgi:hypothetical protein